MPVALQPPVPRPRLHGLLEQGARGPLTLLSAPAGWGKTVAVADWAKASGRGATVQRAGAEFRSMATSVFGAPDETTRASVASRGDGRTRALLAAPTDGVPGAQLPPW